MARPSAIVLTGYGINCDDETAFAFRDSGADSVIVHINDLIGNPGMLKRFQILVFPGGFSYGDDTGSGRAFANKLMNNLMHEIKDFAAGDRLILGICNGFQVMANMGLVPFPELMPDGISVSLEHNRSFRYQCRWVDLDVTGGTPSVFTRGIGSMHIPVAHGEGNFFAPPDVLAMIEERRLAVMRYMNPSGGRAFGGFPHNPNGSLNDIAAVCDGTGRIMGMMPHPERAYFFTQRDDWTLQRDNRGRRGEEMPAYGDGRMIFVNAVEYFR